MKKITLILTILAVLVIGAAPTLAADPASGPFALAAYMPGDINAYIGLRTDDQAIADVDGLLAKLSAFAQEFGAAGVPSNLRDILLQTPEITADDIDAVMAWAGDVIAFGTTDTPDRPGKVVWVLPLDDRAAAEEFVMSRIGDQFEQAGTQGDFTVYEGDGYLLFSDDILLGVSAATPEELTALTSGDYPRLTDRDGFAEAVAALPDSRYTAGLYVSEDLSGELGIGDEGTDPAAVIGMGIRDGATVFFDIFISVSDVIYGGLIDPAFMRHIPDDSSIFYHGSNLGGLIDGSLQGSPRRQIEQGLNSAGLDLDLALEWMSGDFAIFAQLDFRMFWQAVMTGVPAGSTVQDIADGIGVGFVVEATDPEAAARFTQTVATLLRSLPIEEPGSRVETQETLAGTEATVFTITAADGSGVTVRLALASNEDVFAIGTYDAVAAALTGDAGIGADSRAAGVSALLLPDAHAVWFADGEVLSGVTSLGLLAVLGPAVQNVFDDITESLNGTGAPAVTPTPAPDLMASLDFDRLMERLSAFFGYMTGSARPIGDGSLVRLTLTLGQ